eukprot:scaffold6241_cov129-Cylindrotheca_fusiformis.AAC.13
MDWILDSFDYFVTLRARRDNDQRAGTRRFHSPAQAAGRALGEINKDKCVIFDMPNGVQGAIVGVASTIISDEEEES